MSGGPLPASMQMEQLRVLVPGFALIVAVVAAVTDPPDAGADHLLAALPVAAFAAWAATRAVPLSALAPAVLVPVVAAQRGGHLEPLLFEACLLGLVVALWAPSLATAAALGLLAALARGRRAAPGPAADVGGRVDDGHRLPVGARARRRPPGAAGDGARRGAARARAAGPAGRAAADRPRRPRLRGPRAGRGHAPGHRRPARAAPRPGGGRGGAPDGGGGGPAQHARAAAHGRAAAQRRRRRSGTAAAVGRRNQALVAQARAGGLAVELRTHGDLDRIGPGVGVALYRISQEALAKAARHAPRARSVLAIEVADGQVSLVAESTGPVAPQPAGEPEQPHFGLVGMRERAAALGGELTAGPAPGGWRVHCRLPLEASDERSAGVVPPP